jgi:hypothetical protein
MTLKDGRRRMMTEMMTEAAAKRDGILFQPCDAEDVSDDPEGSNEYCWWSEYPAWSGKSF